MPVPSPVSIHHRYRNARFVTSIAVLALFYNAPANAYRPFDSTDADIAHSGELETEFGPLGYVQTAGKHFIVAHSLVLNLGLYSNWELVVQGRDFVLLDHLPGEAHSRLTDTGAFLKGVLREGSLQGKSGLSLATEFGVLLPNMNGDRGVGGTALVILSERWDEATLHVNVAASRTRAGHADGFAGTIIEGPYRWPVRPVVELFTDRELTVETAFSALAGVIWRSSDALSFDLAARAASVGGIPVYEARAGLTWALPVARSL